MTKRQRRLRPFVALPMGLVAAVLLSGQAAAIIYTHQTGLVGPWSWDDSSGAPGVVCNYGPTLDANHYFMKNLVVQPPAVDAIDRNPSKVDAQKVSWQFQIQRKHQPNGHWVVIDSSAAQKGTAHDNASAMFSALTLKHDGHHAGLDTAWDIRVQILIKWYKPNGSVEGTILFRPSYYRGISPDFAFTSSNHYCAEDQTSG